MKPWYQHWLFVLGRFFAALLVGVGLLEIVSKVAPNAPSLVPKSVTYALPLVVLIWAGCWIYGRTHGWHWFDTEMRRPILQKGLPGAAHAVFGATTVVLALGLVPKAPFVDGGSGRFVHRLDRVEVSPRVHELAPQDRLQLKATALDEGGRPLSVGVSFQWVHSGPVRIVRADRDEATVLAAAEKGNAAVRVIASSGDASVESEAQLLIADRPVPPRLASVTITPKSLEVHQHGAARFTAHGRDSKNRLLEGAVYYWRVNGTTAASNTNELVLDNASPGEHVVEVRAVHQDQEATNMAKLRVLEHESVNQADAGPGGVDEDDDYTHLIIERTLELSAASIAGVWVDRQLGAEVRLVHSGGASLSVEAVLQVNARHAAGRLRCSGTGEHLGMRVEASMVCLDSKIRQDGWTIVLHAFSDERHLAGVVSRHGLDIVALTLFRE